ncbi:hypothetical protein OIB37_26775 [Streptomyces sp. NBC_00820]|uniref:hypothetical protein n=1 Tax=Streptomyces sp. NBC_00820 TaxID=2975842 RepID=UPI002ED16CFB|nr:hypothetical protein OIB37_26775 [Streptomyces sp. NBC_00820]
MGDGGGSDVRRGVDALSAFKDQIDKALGDFEGSPGSPSKIEEQALGRTSFGGVNAQFDEAGNLHTQYEHVHERLIHLSKTLGLHIEALKLATHAADVTYDGTEDEVRRRFWQIQHQLDDDYQQAVKQQREHDQVAKTGDHGGKADSGRGHNETVGADQA